MGRFFKFLAKLFEPPPTRLEEIVFEPLDGAEELEALPFQAPDPLKHEVSGGARPEHARPAEWGGDSGNEMGMKPGDLKRGMRISLGELVPLVPPAWVKAGNWSLERTIVIPPEAFLEGSPERPRAVSLRFLAALYAEVFRDPGLSFADPGVDVPMEALRDPSAPPEVITVSGALLSEPAAQREVYGDWAGDRSGPEEREAEARETAQALRGVRLPAASSSVLGGGGSGFEQALRMAEGRSLGAGVEQELKRPGAEAALVAETSRSALERRGNSRLRKILEAYAETLPLVERSASRVEGPREESGGGGESRAAESLAEGGTTGYRMRFEELGLSLSRFPEVKGFALWQAGQSSHTGDLGLEVDLGVLRLRLERLLEGAVLLQGAQDGFSSVTFHHSRGGLSVFGNGSALVAVAHQHEGLPSHLRSWMCGWVSQPLRG